MLNNISNNIKLVRYFSQLVHPKLKALKTTKG